MSYEKSNLKQITIIKTGKLDSNAAVPNGMYPFFTCNPTTLRINTWAYDTEAVLLAGNNASGNYTAKYYKGQFNAYQRTYIIESADKEKLDVRYLAYAMNEELKLLKTMSAGSTTKFLKIGMLRGLEISLPDISIQRKIASILGKYDNFIENNKKQIKLLEEAAQRLYKEWFVDLHFLGYEDVEIVDGVPEGWTKGTLGDVATFKRGKTITKAQVHDGDVPVVAGGLEPAYYHNKANTISPVITVSGSGANAGFARLYNVDIFASDCSFVDSDTTPYLFFVYCFIKNNKDKFNALQKGSAQPHVYAKDINALKILIPTNKLIEEFCDLVSQYFEKIKILQIQIQLSTEARDRLLPKLMNGEIEV